uniref:Secreted protein n=1 Tax=Romanomermis culicivorax TaxID=13658 RepID=A0A915JKQ8_ROMCU
MKILFAEITKLLYATRFLFSVILPGRHSAIRHQNCTLAHHVVGQLGFVVLSLFVGHQLLHQFVAFIHARYQFGHQLVDFDFVSFRFFAIVHFQ